MVQFIALEDRRSWRNVWRSENDKEDVLQEKL